jgi:quercetin dioxygenase-like cupin family protein
MEHVTPGRSVVLKLQSGQTDESLMMFEEAAPTGTGTPMHLHDDSDELTYVLKGEFAFKIGDKNDQRRPRHLRIRPARRCACLEEHWF